jgi:YHS domain-containing protein
MTMTTDPVHGMTVNVENPPARAEYRGYYYYFCAQVCKDAFLQDPAHYAANRLGLRPSGSTSDEKRKAAAR